MVVSDFWQGPCIKQKRKTKSEIIEEVVSSGLAWSSIMDDWRKNFQEDGEVQEKETYGVLHPFRKKPQVIAQATEEQKEEARLMDLYTEKLCRRKKESPEKVQAAMVACVVRRHNKSKRFPSKCVLVVTDIYWPTHCPVFGFKLRYGGGHKGKDLAASIDRIDSLKGYSPDNVQIISFKANRIKSDASEAELKMFANWILDS